MAVETRGAEGHNVFSAASVEASAEREDKDFDFGRLWGTCVESKWLIAAVTAAVALGASIHLYLAVPIYRADALIQIEGGKTAMPGLEEMSVLNEGAASVSAELEILQSRMVLGRVVDRMHLDVVASPQYWHQFGGAVARRFAGPPGTYGEAWFGLSEFAWGGEKISVETLAVPPTWIDVNLELIALADQRYRLHDPSGKPVIEGDVGQRARRELPNGEVLELFLSQLKARPGTRFNVAKISRVAAIRTLQGSLKVKERGQKSQVLELSFRSPDPALDVEILNEIANAYLRQNVERRSEEAEKRLQFVHRQLPMMKDQLEAAEAAFNNYRRQTGAVDMSMATQTILKQIVETESQMRLLGMKREQMLQRLTPTHPLMRALDLQEAEFQKLLADFNAQARLLPDAQQDVLRFNRDVQVNTELYMSMLNSEQGFRVAKAGTIGSVRILDHAVPPAAQVEPNVSKIRKLSIAGGLLAGIGLAFLRRMLRRGVEDPDQIEAELGLPVYASVPHSELQKKITRSEWVPRKGNRAKRKRAVLLALSNQDDLVVESLRSLRTTLVFAMLEARSNSILFTGPAPGVGKSFVSVNFAVVLAQSGKRVLLLDADLRKGHLHLAFGMAREHGLSEFIGQGLDVGAVTRETEVPNLHFISTGMLPPNPSELLLHDRFAELMKQSEATYDYVLVDSPPVLVATDAVIVGQRAGATLMVVRAGVQPMRQLSDTVKKLRQGGTNLRGVIFNDMPLAPSRYGYGYGYRKYAYRYSYKDK